MKGVLVDSNVLLDVFQDDPAWAEWSAGTLDRLATRASLAINPIVYSEVSIGFERIEELEEVLALCPLRLIETPKEALFLAGKVYLQYRRRKGVKRSPLPDFYIGAHAAVSRMALMTRDPSRYAFYFPSVELITPGGPAS